MSSACINPILYGYLNETFRKEFKEIAAPLKNCLETKILPKCCVPSKENPTETKDFELEPLEVKVQNGSKKVENKLIPREATSNQLKSIELITVHNVKS